MAKVNVKGNRTYALCAVAIVMLNCQMFGVYTFPAEAWGLVGTNILIFLRMGMK